MGKLLQWMGLETKPEVLDALDRADYQGRQAFILKNQARELLGLPPQTWSDNYELGLAEILHELAVRATREAV